MEKKGIVTEFKEFITRGNVMDMAVGIIIGGAFTAIVTSLVNDLLMPVIGALFGYLLIPFMARAMVMFNNYQDSLHQYLHESR